MHLHIKWRAWLNTIGWWQRVGSSWGCWMTLECSWSGFVNIAISAMVYFVLLFWRPPVVCYGEAAIVKTARHVFAWTLNWGVAAVVSQPGAQYWFSDATCRQLWLTHVSDPDRSVMWRTVNQVIVCSHEKHMFSGLARKFRKRRQLVRVRARERTC